MRHPHQDTATIGTFQSVSLTGVLCGRGPIVLGWPEAHEFDVITQLRNVEVVRQWFLDDRPLDPEVNRVWLANLDRPREAVLAIRLLADNRFIGMIGWSNWDPCAGTITIGRLALDRKVLRRLLRRTYVHTSIALDAAMAIRDFIFMSMHVQRIVTSYISGNTLAARVNRGIGMTVTDRRVRERPDGRQVEMIELVLERDRWLAHQ